MKISLNQNLVRLIKLLILLPVMLLSACGGPHVVKISEAEVQKKFNEKVNVPIKLIKIFDVSLSNPVVKLDGASERLQAHFDVKIDSSVTGTIYGQTSVSGVLKYDETKGAIIFSETQFDKVELTEADKSRLTTKYALTLNMLTEKLGGIFLNGLTLRKVESGELKFLFVKYNITKIKVADGNLQVTLVPLN